MILVAESALLVWLGLACLRLYRLGTLGVLLDFGSFLLACLAGGAASLAARHTLYLFSDNPILAFALACLAGLIGFMALRWWGHKHLRRHRRRSEEERIADGRVRNRLDRGGAVACCVVYLGLWAALLAILINLLAAGFPSLRRSAEDRSFYLHVLLLPEPAPPPATEEERLHEAMTRQQRFLTGLRTRVGEGVDWVTETTGTKHALRHLSAMRALTALDEQRLAMLVTEFPALQELLAQPTLLAVLENPNTLARLETAGGGDPAAIYALGEDPRIRTLLADPAFRHAVENFPLLAAAETAEVLQRELIPLPCAWQRRAGDAGPWRPAGPAGVAAWDPSHPTGHLRTEVDLPVESTVRVLIYSPVVPNVRIGSATLPVRHHRGVALAHAHLPPGTHTLSITFPLTDRATHRALVYRSHADGDG